MEQLKLLSMTTVLTVLIWATADSLVNESAVLEAVIDASADAAHPDMRVEVERAPGVFRIEVTGPRKVVAAARAATQLSITLLIPESPTGEQWVSLAEALQDQWHDYPKLQVTAVTPPRAKVVVDHMVTRDVPLTLKPPTLTYAVAPQLSRDSVKVRFRESHDNAMREEGNSPQIVVDPERPLREKPAGNSVTVRVALQLDPRRFGDDATATPSFVDVTATIHEDREVATISLCPVRISVSAPYFGRAFRVEDADGPIRLLVQSITVAGPAQSISKLRRDAPPAGFVHLREEDLKTWPQPRSFIPAYYDLPAGVVLVQEPEAVRFRLVEIQ
jgi:hypothetical protein